MAKNRFKVLGGIHEGEDGVTYKKDEVVESDHDLDTMFAEKFRRLSGPTKPSRDLDTTIDEAGKVTDLVQSDEEFADTSKVKAAAVTAKVRPVTSVPPAAPDEDEHAAGEFGSEVTESFPKAPEGVVIFKGAGGYTVAEASAPDQPINEETLRTKKDVEKFLASIQS